MYIFWQSYSSTLQSFWGSVLLKIMREQKKARWIYSSQKDFTAYPPAAAEHWHFSQWSSLRGILKAPESLLSVTPAETELMYDHTSSASVSETDIWLLFWGVFVHLLDKALCTCCFLPLHIQVEARLSTEVIIQYQLPGRPSSKSAYNSLETHTAI